MVTAGTVMTRPVPGHDGPPADTRGGWVPARDRGGPAVLETTDGGWQLGADPDTGWCVAVYQPGPLNMDTLFDTPTAMVVTVSSPNLEARLGWILPDSVHTAIQSGHAVLPAPADSTTGPTGRRVPEPLELLESDDSRRPAPSHRVHIPGRPVDTYRRALAGSRVLQPWVLDSLENPADHYRIVSPTHAVTATLLPRTLDWTVTTRGVRCRTGRPSATSPTTATCAPGKRSAPSPPPTATPTTSGSPTHHTRSSHWTAAT